MDLGNTLKSLLFFNLLVTASACLAEENSALEGTWRITSYFNAPEQLRYSDAEGYMMFGKAHYTHLMFINRDERPRDFAEAHHGTYQITEPGVFTMRVDMDLHMDPLRKLQDEPVWYGPTNSISGLKYRIDGDTATIDFPSSTQIIMEKVE